MHSGLVCIVYPIVIFIAPVLPQLTPPMFAYPMFFIYHNVCVFIALCWFAFLLGQIYPKPWLISRDDRLTGLGGSHSHPSATALVRRPRLFHVIPPLLCGFATWLVGFPSVNIYSSFVPKVIVLLVGITLTVLLQVNLFISMAKHWDANHRKLVAQQHANSLGLPSPVMSERHSAVS